MALHKDRHPFLEIDIDAVMSGKQTTEQVAQWLLVQGNEMPIAYSSADPAAVQTAQARYGKDEAANRIEELFVSVARSLFDSGMRRIVTAGGETSGAVVEGLEIAQLEIGAEIAPGVPAVRDPQTGLCLALKSGNFGQDDFFERAVRALGSQDGSTRRAAS